MGIEVGTALAIGAVLTAVTAAAGTGLAVASANAQAAAAQETLNLQAKEAERQLGEVRRIESEQKSDRIRNANASLGALRVASAEVGQTSTAFARSLAEIAADEGTDLGRIERNADNSIAAIRANLSSGTSSTTSRLRQLEIEKAGAIAGGVGSGLQIGTDFAARNARLERRRNRTT